MEDLLKSALPSLAKELQYRLEKISIDENISRDTLFKLVLERENTTTLYISSGADYVSSGDLSEEEKNIIEHWLESVRARKIEHEKRLSQRHL